MSEWELERQKTTLDVMRLLLTRIVTLSTALIAAGVALAKLSPPHAGGGGLFFAALCALGLSVLFGLLALGAILASLTLGAMDVGRSWLLQILTALVVASFAAGLGLSIFLARGLWLARSAAPLAGAS